MTKAVNKKFRIKGLDVATTDGNSVIQLAVDYVVSASRSLKHNQLRKVVHEMMYLYMDTKNDCLITQQAIHTFRHRIIERSKSIKPEDLEPYFSTKFLVKPRSA